MGKKSKNPTSANGSASTAARTTPSRNGNSNNPTGPGKITLPNGQEIPVAPPPGIDPAMYEQALQYLRQNPEVAMRTQEQVQRLGNPAVAQRASAQLQDPEYRKKVEALREDPDLKPVFDDIAASGAAGMDKYWNDGDLMSRISRKMAELGVQPEAPQPPAKSLPVRPTTLHEAAKLGDAEALAELLSEAGVDVNARDERGIKATPLGVAVGFNRLSVVKMLLEAGADVALTDAKGNTPLHYAAGYGRKDAAALLLDAGAALDSSNSDGQTPVQVAETNREMQMVDFLKARAAADGSGAPLKEVTDADKYL